MLWNNRRLTDVRLNDKITALCCVSTGKERIWQKSKKTVKQKRGC